MTIMAVNWHSQGRVKLNRETEKKKTKNEKGGVEKRIRKNSWSPSSVFFILNLTLLLQRSAC